MLYYTSEYKKSRPKRHLRSVFCIAYRYKKSWYSLRWQEKWLEAEARQFWVEIKGLFFNRIVLNQWTWPLHLLMSTVRKEYVCNIYYGNKEIFLTKEVLQPVLCTRVSRDYDYRSWHRLFCELVHTESLLSFRSKKRVDFTVFNVWIPLLHLHGCKLIPQGLLKYGADVSLPPFF